MSDRARVLGSGLPAGALSGTTATRLDSGWSLTSTDANSCATPGDVDAHEWHDAVVPGTLAMAIGPKQLDRHRDYDAEDWWYRTTFAVPERGAADRVHLRFDGLATLAEAWLNGERVLESSNMFCAQSADVTDLIEDENELHVVFRSLGEALAQKRRPRPRWKTRLVDNQALRWFRTTLLGRIPGWTPAIAPVGPWRPIWVEVASSVLVDELDLTTDVVDGGGVVTLSGSVRTLDGPDTLESARLTVGDHELDVDVTREGDGWALGLSGSIAHPDLWWPVTHGDQPLYECRLHLTTSSHEVVLDCGRVGFRSLSVDRSDGGVRLLINDMPVFCRGACWTTNDIVSLVGDPAETRRTLELVAQANGNMVRVGGTMVYETDAFYAACDELGILVWQDFMFANMDYPAEDEDFAASIRAEAVQQLRRLGRHPSLVAFCGGSEVEQQAAMFGAAPELWTNDFFGTVLPDLVESHAPGRPYWSSSPTGGDLPFHPSSEIAHYFGVGAYLRSLDDARLAGVQFTTECLGFSNVPDDACLKRLTAGGSVPPHNPAWKAGVPRDSGAGWDFEDVRDHYLERLHDVDAVDLRSFDLERYLTLSRTVTGRVMARCFDEWRSPENPCWGGLVWFLRDLRPGAGWGVIDADNAPKAAYHFLKRAWAPRRVAILDRGLDGLRLEIHNESADPASAEVEVLFYDSASVVTARASESVDVAARSVEAMNVEGLLGHFADPTYSYRFGPRRHHAVAAVAEFGDGEVSTAVYWAGPTDAIAPSGMVADTEVEDDGGSVRISAEGLVAAARIEIPGWEAEDNYVDLLPGVDATIRIARRPAHDGPARGYLDATNASAAVRLAGAG